MVSQSSVFEYQRDEGNAQTSAATDQIANDNAVAHTEDDELEQVIKLSEEEARTFAHNPHSDSSFGPPRSVGLINGGNTCWFNASLQALFHIPEFRQLVLAIDYDVLQLARTLCETYANLLRELRLLFAALHRGVSDPGTDQYAIDPSDTLIALRTACMQNQPSSAVAPDSFTTQSKQQDATEFLNKLLDILDAIFCLQESGSIGCANAIKRLFFGELLKSNGSKDKFSQLLLLVSGTEHVLDGIEQLLFGRLEDSEVGEGETWFLSLPTILCITFQRHDFDAQSQRSEKLLDVVRFDRELDLTPYCINKTTLESGSSCAGGCQLAQRAAHEAIVARIRSTKQLLIERTILASKLDVYDADKEIAGENLMRAIERYIATRSSEDQNGDAANLRLVRSILQQMQKDLHDETNAIRTRLAEIDALLEACRRAPVPSDAEPGTVSYKYRLHAVIMHDGQSTNGGHYRAYVADDAHASNWAEYNDSHVTRVSYSVIEALQRGEAAAVGSVYCIVYVRTSGNEAEEQPDANADVPATLLRQLTELNKYPVQNMTRKWADGGWPPVATTSGDAASKRIRRSDSHRGTEAEDWGGDVTMVTDLDQQQYSTGELGVAGRAANWCKFYTEAFFNPQVQYSGWSTVAPRNDNSTVLAKIAALVTDNSQTETPLLSAVLTANVFAPIDFAFFESLPETLLDHLLLSPHSSDAEAFFGAVYCNAAQQVMRLSKEWRDSFEQQSPVDYSARIYGIDMQKMEVNFSALLNSDIALCALPSLKSSRLRKRVAVQSLTDVRLLHTSTFYLCSLHEAPINGKTAEDSILKSLILEHMLTADCASLVRNATPKVRDADRFLKSLRHCVDEVENHFQLLFTRECLSNRVLYSRVHFAFACLRLAVRAFQEAVKPNASVDSADRSLMQAQRCFVLQTELRRIHPRCGIQPAALVTYLRYYALLRWNSEMQNVVTRIGTQQFDTQSNFDDWSDNAGLKSGEVTQSDREMLRSIVNWVKHAIGHYVRSFSKSELVVEKLLAELIVRGWSSLTNQESLFNRPAAEALQSIAHDLVIAHTEPDGTLDNENLLSWLVHHVRTIGPDSQLLCYSSPSASVADEFREAVEMLDALLVLGVKASQ